MIRALVLCALLVLVGGVALLNWPLFMAPTSVSLGLTVVELPLGLMMLGLLLLVCVLFGVWAVSLQAGALRDARRQSQDLAHQRELADRAEASRFTELRGHLATELVRVSQAVHELRVDMLARLDRQQDDLRAALDETTRSLEATLGEMDDRLTHEAALTPLEGVGTALGASR
jgi:hypothetical protein